MYFNFSFKHFKFHYQLCGLNDILARGIGIAAKFHKKWHKHVIVRYTKFHFSKYFVFQIKEMHIIYYFQ